MKHSIYLALAALLVASPFAFAQGDKPAEQPKPAEKPAAKPVEKPQDVKPAPHELSPIEKMAKAWEDAAKVGPNHKLLKHFEGAWDAEIHELTPGMETTDSGVLTATLIRGDRFLSIDFKGKSHGKPLEGGGLWGYSNVDKRFEETWADNLSTQLSFLTGSADKAGKVFTMTGEYTDPVSGKKSQQKEVTTIVNKDSYRSEFYMTEDGKESKVMEIVYTRAKPPEKPKDEAKDEKK